jgi:hypothetical protein
MGIKTKILTLGILVAGLLSWESPKAQAAQYFAKRYTFTQQGELTLPLVMRFKNLGEKHIAAKITPFNSKTNILTLACSLGDNVFLTTINNGYEYALYKLDFRPGNEDLLVISYGPRGTGKTELGGITVIGQDENGTLGVLPLRGFSEVAVFNSPLQIRNKQAVLFRDKASTLITIEWDKDLASYVVRGTE